MQLLASKAAASVASVMSVSYTHLDVYKRQLTGAPHAEQPEDERLHEGDRGRVRHRQGADLSLIHI